MTGLHAAEQSPCSEGPHAGFVRGHGRRRRKEFSFCAIPNQSAVYVCVATVLHGLPSCRMLDLMPPRL